MTAAQKKKRRDEPGSEDEDFSDDDVQALDSDNLDDDDADTARRAGTKRKKNSSATKPPKRRRAAVPEEEDEGDLELKEGQEVVGKIVRAPKTGLGGLRMFQRRATIKPASPAVPPGQISQNTFDFLNKLREPECNDREWFASIPRLLTHFTLLTVDNLGSN